MTFDLLAEMLRCRCLYNSFSASAASFLSPTVVPSASSLPRLQQHASEPPSSPASRVNGRAAGSRVFILGRRKEEEVETSEALRALRAYSMATKPETVEVNIKVDMTLKKDKVRDPFKGPVVLPHTFGQETIILFVIESSYHEAALKAGADIVGAEEIFNELEEETLNFDICLTTPSMLDGFKPLQRKLKSKMPNIRRGTVVGEDSIPEAVRQFKTRKEFRSDKVGNILVPVGKLDFPDEDIIENITSLLRGVLSHHGNVPKSSFIRKVLLTSTYGPAFPVTTKQFL
ncbi:50S ribosomal protein L1 [Geodia barretti]|uniref:50S ribosomal protein L1 n=1 Tax=Geodia barretti TaxID=519541 RepID=A0AA35SM67_GEOBA|nr:50S ribosomal protein L1 [Geodia barretti]